MANNIYISDELLAAYLDGNTSEAETLEVLNALEYDPALQEALDISLQLEEDKEPALQIAAESGKNLCDIKCEAYILHRLSIDCTVDELLEVAKDHHWILKAGTPLNYIGNLLRYYGLNVMQKYGATIEEIKELLEGGDSIIAAVDSDKLYPERPDEEDATNHAVVITRIDTEANIVTIYDPVNIEEIDFELPLFIYAWKESNNYIVRVSQ